MVSSIGSNLAKHRKQHRFAGSGGEAGRLFTVKDGSERHRLTEASVMVESDETSVRKGFGVAHPARLERAACGFEVPFRSILPETA